MGTNGIPVSRVLLGGDIMGVALTCVDVSVLPPVEFAGGGFVLLWMFECREIRLSVDCYEHKLQMCTTV